MKAKRLRVFFKEAHSIVRGWYFNYAPLVKLPVETCEKLKEIARFQCPVIERSELGVFNRNRLENMHLCSNVLDLLIIKPGMIFSLQKHLGEATEKRGFKSGPVIIKGKLSDAPGGGLCQVSTVLFNTALIANLEILEKHNHSVDIWGEQRIADLGRDAAYVYARKDLKFKNSLDWVIVLRMGVSSNGTDKSLWASFLSETKLPYKVIVSTKVTPVFDTHPHIGSEPAQVKGYRTETHREVVLDGKNSVTYKKMEYYKAKGMA